MKDNFTSIIAILDASGSMSPLAEETISGFNKFIEDQKAEEGEAILTIATFNYSTEIIHNAINLKDATPLTDRVYTPSGGTALYDAIGTVIKAHGEKLAAMPEEERPSKVLVLVMTDGQENLSQRFGQIEIANMIKHQTDKYNWQFIYMGANQDSFAVGQTIGVAKTNSYNYTASSAGTGRLFANISAGTRSYRRAVATAGAPAPAYSMPDPTEDDTKDVDMTVKVDSTKA